jgi:hypothetical protein
MMKKTTLLTLFIALFAFASAQIHEETFDSELGSYTAYSIEGDQEWYNNDFGVPANSAAISGYDGEAFENEDWLVSPAIDLSDATGTTLNFYEAINFGTGNIDTEQEVYISTDYSGSGDPTADGNWTKLTVTGHASGDSWDFVEVDEIDLSDYDGNASVYLAFKYTSTTDGAATWEIDNIVVDEPSTDPSITLTYPNGGEVFEQGDMVDIAWTSENFSGEVDIELMGANGMMIAEGVENSGSYEWTIPDDQAAADDYTIKVAGAADGTPMDESDEPFSIQETVDAIFEGTFDSDLSGWTAISVEGEQEWYWADFGLPPGSAAMSGYDGGALANEDWLISSPVDLSDISGTKLNFDEAINFGTGNIADEQEIMVSTDYTGSGDPSAATWTKLNVTGRAAGDSWDFVPVDETDLSAYDGYEEVYIAFKYTSTTDGAATWEVDNVVVTGDETIGIAEEQFTADMKLYPNPSDGRITITSSAIDNAEYNVFSVTGELVSQGTLKSNHNTVDLSSLNGGIYTVQIVEDGKTAVKRIIIR